MSKDFIKGIAVGMGIAGLAAAAAAVQHDRRRHRLLLLR